MSGDNILFWPEVHQRVRLCRQTIWRAVKAKEFPAPIRLGRKRIGWVARDIDAWIDSRRNAA